MPVPWGRMIDDLYRFFLRNSIDFLWFGKRLNMLIIFFQKVQV